MALTFAGTDLTAGGLKTVWSYTPAVMQRKLEIVHLARAQGELVKDLGLIGCDHALQVKYLNVPANQLSALMSALSSLSSAAATTGTLVVDTVASVANCVCTSVKTGSPELRGLVTASGYQAGSYYDLQVDFTFRQLRS